MYVDWVLSTDGSGLWTSKALHVYVDFLDLIDYGSDYGELRVYFDTFFWNVNEDGLLYTDPKFLSELREHLEDIGLDPESVDYSEQGMQGHDYVSFDVSHTFLASWYNVTGRNQHI